MNLVKLQYTKLTHRNILRKFLHTNNERSEREINETIPFSIATIRIKYLGINLPKEAKDLYAENYKILMKEIKVDQKGGEIYHVLRLEESILWK